MGWRISGRLAQAAATLIDEGFMAGAGVAQLAARIGVTERHLRRLFDAEFGVSVHEYAQTQKLLLAKRLLTDTALPVTEVALAAGFGSVRRFNDVLKERYGLTPLAMRKRADGMADRLVFELGYRPPLAWERCSDFWPCVPSTASNNVMARCTRARCRSKRAAGVMRAGCGSSMWRGARCCASRCPARWRP
jgi:AraC-like DNA-binding protein